MSRVRHTGELPRALMGFVSQLVADGKSLPEIRRDVDQFLRSFPTNLPKGPSAGARSYYEPVQLPASDPDNIFVR